MDSSEIDREHLHSRMGDILHQIDYNCFMQFIRLNRWSLLRELLERARDFHRRKEYAKLEEVFNDLERLGSSHNRFMQMRAAEGAQHAAKLKA